MLRAQPALHNDIDLRAAGMRVRRIEPTGIDEAQRHRDARPDERWEGLTIGLDGVAAVARRRGVGGRVVEVVDEVAGVAAVEGGEEVGAVFGGGGEGELVDEVLAVAEDVVVLTGLEG